MTLRNRRTPYYVLLQDADGLPLIIALDRLLFGVGGGHPDATYLTENDERVDLPNSRRVLAGDNITFDDTTPGARTLSAVIPPSSEHTPGIMRVLGDGATTVFNLLDIAEFLFLVSVNGVITDPATYTLSADRSQITFDTAPGALQVVVITYVIANL